MSQHVILDGSVHPVGMLSGSQWFGVASRGFYYGKGADDLYRADGLPIGGSRSVILVAQAKLLVSSQILLQNVYKFPVGMRRPLKKRLAPATSAHIVAGFVPTRTGRGRARVARGPVCSTLAVVH